jgi:polyhydroxybutyrate depolymerase
VAVAAPGQSSGKPKDPPRCIRTLPAGTSTVQVSFGGTSYPVRVHVPAGVRTRQELPLVLDLHGSQSNGVVQAGISDLSSVADAEHFIVANPSGAIPLAQQNPPLPDGSWAWNVPGVPTTAGQFPPADARDDIAYLTRVIDTLDRSGCVDDRRTYAAGYSGGGRMASALACARPDKIAAIAPIAGLRAGRPSPVDTSVPEIQNCTPSKAVAAITFHGDADVVNPYPGNGDLRWGYPVSVAVQSWARIDDCRVGPDLTTISEHVVRYTYSRCRDGADVVLYKVLGGGHTWPGTSVDLSPLGVTTQEIDASELLWDFFTAHPRRNR